MTIILFLIDTSASMCQKVHVNGVQKTYLDVAKGAVETFLKFRQRSQDCMGDRYMLLTFEEPPSNVKAGWKENHATFMNELKNLQSNGLTCMGEALKNGFDLLNLNRMQSGIDTYGQGRCPFYLETSVIIVITDGGKYSFRNGVHNEIVLPLHAQIPGTKLTKEPFRWDQRLFSLVLRMAGHRVDERIDVKVPHDDSPIEKMCEVTGGRSYKVRSHYVLNHCIESLVQKVQPGVVVQFDQSLPLLGGARPPAEAEAVDLVFPTTKRMIYVQKNMSAKNYPIGYWPLPEPYWPDPKAAQLPPRDAHPRIRVLSPCVDEPVPVRNFPVDKYELEASPLTMQILSRRDQSRCWPVAVANMCGPLGPAGLQMPQHDLPFGYLKAHASFTQVHLVVLPLNYPVLLPLLHDLFHRYMGNPPNEWVYKFNTYLRGIPQYYCPFLRRALAAINVPYQLLSFIIPESLDSYLSQAVANHLKALKNAAKQDLEALCMRIFKQMKQPRPPHRQVETAKLLPLVGTGNCAAVAAATQQQQQPSQAAASSSAAALRKEMVSHPMLRDTFGKLHSDCQVYDNFTVVVPVATIRGQLTTGSTPVTGVAGGGPTNGGPGGGRAIRNPFDIRRRDLVDEIARMRENFFKLVGVNGVLGSAGGGVAGAAGHCLPISEMGNYQEYLKNKETPLREIEPTNVRQHMFGNPYKKDKHMVMVDEADLVNEGPLLKGQGLNSPAIGVGPTGGGGAGALMLAKKLDGSKLSRKRKAGPIAREFKFRRLSTSSVSSSNSGSEYGADSDTGSVASDDFEDEEEQRLVMDFDEASAAAVATESAEAPLAAGEEINGGGEAGRLNGEGEEAPAHDRLAPPSAVLVNNSPAVPVVLTPSEGVLSPMYQQPPSPFQAHSLGQGAAPLATIGNITGSAAAGGLLRDARKPLANGQTGPSVSPVERTQTSPASSSTPSSSSLSNFNDADEISKILQQSCSQHNGAAAADQDVRRKGRAGHEADGEEKPGAAATALGGRRRRQLSKQASTEALEVPGPTTDGATDEEGGSSARRHSPRMAGPAVGAKTANFAVVASAAHERLSGAWLEDEAPSQPPSRRKGDTANRAVKREEEAEEDENVNEDETPLGGWDGRGESADAVREANYETRTVLFRDIRRPGRDYALLLEHLELVRGDFETRFSFVQGCIAEALRFHRKKMATTIQEWWDQKIDTITRAGDLVRGRGACGNGETVAAVAAAAAPEGGNGGRGKGSAGRPRAVKMRSGGGGGALTPSKC